MRGQILEKETQRDITTERKQWSHDYIDVNRDIKA
jgi:hypothetical protein